LFKLFRELRGHFTVILISKIRHAERRLPRGKKKIVGWTHMFVWVSEGAENKLEKRGLQTLVLHCIVERSQAKRASPFGEIRYFPFLRCKSPRLLHRNKAIRVAFSDSEALYWRSAQV
jgi:hypothetical protein